MSIHKVLLVAFLTGLIAQQALGQAANSPFSSFGVGDLYGNAQANAQGMAGVGVSNPQYWYLNTINPALLVFNGNLTTFQAGILGDRRTLKDGTQTESNGGGNLNYLLLGFPIVKGKWSTSVGLMPYSTVRYNYSYTSAVENSTGTAFFNEKGTGGINQLSWSNGVVLHKYLSVGARANYLYSSTEHTFSNTVKLGDDQLIILSPSIYQRFYYSDFSFTGAASLHIDSIGSKNYKLNVGAVYDFQADIRTELFETLVRQNQAGNVVSTDTLTTKEIGQTRIPSALALGLSFGKAETWTFGVDARFTDYSSFRNFERRATPTQQGWKVAAGFELTPDPTSLSSYVKRITYRTGVSLEESPFLVNNNVLRDFGINFGFSAPVSRISSVDLGIRVGRRGNIADNTIEEKYFKIYFGVTFNDRWFIKRRFD